MDNPEILSTLAHKTQDADTQNTRQKIKKMGNSDPTENRGLSQEHTKDK